MGVRPLLAQAPVALRPLLAQAPVALRANNVRPYGYACADGLHGAPGVGAPYGKAFYHVNY
ncbi:hypothetical protein DXA92_14400 [Agathobaculum butyriciproducens]|nr:hypothetical protein DXA94_14610 [Agathobaculum butyriciproducens]RGC57690.1 hypothetical protein DXA92_14400 [Agathobaculum butyriciproducens]